MSRAIGIDIGHGSVRAVVLSQGRQGWHIAGTAAVPRRDAAGDPRPLPAVLAELDSRVGLGRGALSVADSGQSLLVRYVNTIPLAEERLIKLLRLELAQHADANGELAGDAYSVPLAGNEIIQGCALAQPAQIRDLLADFRRAGLTPRRIHVGAAALYNITLAEPVVRGEGFALLVDIGTLTTRVALVGEGRLLAFRQLAIGGKNFTDVVAGSRGVEEQRAEALKRQWTAGQVQDLASTGTVSTGKAATLLLDEESGSSEVLAAASRAEDEPFVLADDGQVSDPAISGSVPSESVATAATVFEAPEGDDAPTAPGRATMAFGGMTLGPDMTRVAEAFFGQLASTIAWFKAQLQNERLQPERVVLSGGGAALAGLQAWLERRFRMPVTILDPFAGLTGQHPDDPHEYAVAVGLALSEAAGATRLDLLPERIVRSRLWRERLVWPYVAAAALLVAAGIAGLTLWQRQSRHAENLAAMDAYVTDHGRLGQELENLNADNDAMRDDLRTVASRIHFNRDLLYVIRVLKELAPKNAELWVTRLETIPTPIETKSAGGSRLTTGGRTPALQAETTVDRGSIEIEGRVKFDKALTPEEQNKFFNDYMSAIDKSVAGSSGVELFDPEQTKVFKHLQVEEPAVAGPQPVPRSGTRPVPQSDGSYPFGIRYSFIPLDLRQATTAVDLPGAATDAP